MKTFLANNWYKLIISCSFIIFSISLFIFSISSSRANSVNNELGLGIGSEKKIEVSISKEQIDLIINSIYQNRVIKIDEKQFNDLKPTKIQPVDIIKLNGVELCTEILTSGGYDGHAVSKFCK